jgi:hypothetical protein
VLFTDLLHRCDACRKRKICCTRDAYEKDCSLCRTRGESCKYVLPPNVRRNRQPGVSNRPRVPASSSSLQSLGSANGLDQRVSVETTEWICQFVGLSGDQDPFVLRHCTFNQLNCYKAPDWAILRIKGEPPSIPLHFTVCLSPPPPFQSLHHVTNCQSTTKQSHWRHEKPYTDFLVGCAR